MGGFASRPVVVEVGCVELEIFLEISVSEIALRNVSVSSCSEVIGFGRAQLHASHTSSSTSTTASYPDPDMAAIPYYGGFDCIPLTIARCTIGTVVFVRRVGTFSTFVSLDGAKLASAGS